MTRTWRTAAVAMLWIAACDAGVEGRGQDSSDTETLAVGRSVYVKHCATCHGTAGEGAAGWQELNEAGEMPAPPHDSTGHTWRHSDAVLYRITERGWRDPFNRTQRLTMPAFGDSLAPEQIRAVIGYLKTLWTAKQRRFQVEESRGEPFPKTSDGVDIERSDALRARKSDKHHIRRIGE